MTSGLALSWLQRNCKDQLLKGSNLFVDIPEYCAWRAIQKLPQQWRQRKQQGQVPGSLYGRKAGTLLHFPHMLPWLSAPTFANPPMILQQLDTALRQTFPINLLTQVPHWAAINFSFCGTWTKNFTIEICEGDKPRLKPGLHNLSHHPIVGTQFRPRRFPAVWGMTLSQQEGRCDVEVGVGRRKQPPDTNSTPKSTHNILFSATI